MDPMLKQAAIKAMASSTHGPPPAGFLSDFTSQLATQGVDEARLKGEAQTAIGFYELGSTILATYESKF